ncbi:MAG: DUF4465 domain-containing protein [Muribaculaceae bacterium]|nr:DUF4465 domain-containing protein [Muribaculaceae bacterium]
MRQIFSIGLLTLAISTLSAQEKIVTLDLSKATTPLVFNENTGAWTGTYDDDAESIESQCFSFVHSSISDWNTWWGFTASNSADNAKRDNFITYQFSNMAEGGIALDDSGAIQLDEFGAPVVSASMPYLVAFYSPYMAARPVDMTLDPTMKYEAVGVYVNLNSYAYYTIQDGDSYARAFTNGDKFTLTVHGVGPNEAEKEVEVELASYANGNLTLNRGWRYVDLSALGEVNELYFTLETTDVGEWGANTPMYFCLDKLMVKELGTVGISEINAPAKETIKYDRATRTVTVSGSEFTVVYDCSGRQVMTSDSRVFSLENLSAGVYLIRSGAASIKIAK